MKKEIALKLISKEYNDAKRSWPTFNSTHEGYAVILEELDELWDEIKANGPQGRLQDEAVQVAAMALRFLIDLT
jgi:hypothetical protein